MVPREVSQKGIADSINRSRSYVSRVIRQLMNKGLVKEKLKYLKENQKRKRKVYFLTKEGIKKEKQLREHLLSEEVKVRTKKGVKQIQICDLDDYVNAKDILLFAILNIDKFDEIDLRNFEGPAKPDFINRQAEIEKLQKKLDQVKENGCSVIFVVGKAGIGKTSLTMELKKYSKENNFKFLHGKGYFETTDPYTPLKTAFEEYSDDYDGGITFSIFDKSMEGEKSHKKRKFNNHFLFFDFMDELKKFSEIQPLVIFLDDLHWSDSSTLRLLYYLVDNLEENPVLFIGAYRSGAIDSKHPLNDIRKRLSRIKKYDEIELEPLGWKDTRKMVLSILNSQQISSEVIDVIHSITEGNPLFIKEFTDLLLEEGILPIQGADHEINKENLDIPRIIDDTLQRQLDINLSRKSKNLAEIGSVIGEIVPYELLLKCSELKEMKVLSAINELIESEIWEEDSKDNKFIFEHKLMVKIIYKDIPHFKKRKLHRIVGDQIKEIYASNIEEYYSDIAYHYDRGEKTKEAVEYYIKAGEEAERRFAHENAVNLYEKALTLATNTKRIYVYNKLGKAYMISGDFNQASKYFKNILDAKNCTKKLKQEVIAEMSDIYIKQGNFKEAMEISEKGMDLIEEDNSLKCRLLHSKGIIKKKIGDYKKAEDFFKEERKIAEKIDDQNEISRALHGIGTLKINKGENEEALKFLKKSLKIRRGIDNNKGISDTLNNMGIIFKRIGDYEKALECFDETLEIEKKIDNKQGMIKVLNNIGIINKNLGNFEKAIEYYQQSLDIGKKLGDNIGMAKINVNIGNIYEISGHYDEALNYFNEALDIEKDIGDKAGIGAVLNNIGSIYHKKGDLERALKHHKRSMEIGRKLGLTTNVAGSLYNIGTIYHDQGDYDKAFDYFNESYKKAKEVEEKRLMIYIKNSLADTCLMLRSTEKALEYAMGATDISEKMGAKRELGISYRILGKVHREISDFKKAKKDFDKAKSILREINDKVELSKVLYEEGVLLSEINNPKEANKCFNDAMTLFKKHNKVSWVEKCVEQLDNLP